MVKQIEDVTVEYVQKAVKLEPTEKCSNVKGIVGMLDKAQELSEDKIQLAMQTYEMVDKHIRRLDSELARLENELKEKQLNVSSEEKSKKRGKTKKKKGSASSFHPKNVIKEESDKGRKRQKGSSSAASANVDVANGLLFDSSGGILNSEVLDMPVDPNEPTYCTCHQVSYGEMIGCDNLDCPIEWFHFGCVGLTQKPKGKWYCSKCIVDKKKGKN